MPVRDRLELRHRLSRLAATQAGYFTASQALKAGYSYQAQRYHVQRGTWRRVDRGLFRLPEWPTGPHEDLVRWSLWSRGRAIISHETALTVHDLGDANPAQVHLTVPPSFRAKAPGIVLHRGELLPTDIEEREGFRVTTPVRSVLDVAASDADLDQVARAVADLLRRGLATRRSLRERGDAAGARAALRIERALGAIEP